MMNKQILFTAVMLIGFTSISVSGGNRHEEKKPRTTKGYRYAQPIVFVEGNVQFMVFPDGSFDFSELNSRTFRHLEIGRRPDRVQNRISSGDLRPVNYSTRRLRPQIAYNRFGEISMINAIHINYDKLGRVRHIGSVPLGYQRGNERLRTVGDLRVNYNHWGEIVHLRGSVNTRSINLNNSSFLHRGEYSDDDIYDDDYYYYKMNGKLKKQKKRKKLKR